jgi:3-oxoacyl-(acyl-carrier-protein) synthase
MAAGMEALREADIKVPDGIITGTGYGCLDDTGIFLSKMIENKEQALNPTPFIQSTHNTIGSQLALLLHCQGYNQTYTQRALSFENALLDACLSIGEDPTQWLLTGAADEITNVSHDLLRRFHVYRRNNVSSLALFETPSTGTLNGEGAAYFLLSGSPHPGAVRLQGVQTFYKASTPVIADGIAAFLEAHACRPEDIDVVFSGACGDDTWDSSLGAFLQGQFPKATYAVFKHLTGEFPTASALAMVIATRTIQARTVPEAVIRKDARRAPGNVLIFNGYYNLCHSMILLSAS